MDVTLKVWRQKNSQTPGKMVEYKLSDISPDMSFLEMFDVLNEQLAHKGDEPVAFDHDCREGICGMCSMYINGRPHGPQTGTTTCQLHMRNFNDGDTIVVEPWRALAFPVIKDLVVDRDALDRIVQAGGYVSVNTGSAPDANEMLIPREIAEEAMDAAQCIACGACVAACKNASAMLFTAAKVSHLAVLPQGKAEHKLRAERMVAQMDAEGFGACSFTGACAVECPKSISLDHIARLNREYLGAKLTSNNV
ncbi:succinate dehydrogenase / fumarate reductase iron-sulfur subunit [Larkinella arboricola]|uniref:Succinate dehydrogenase / fumarate reductase iron-sulfur subunit n=1 Tax=Larkinella arboricola TaxID=643671 RepID=A0A327X7P0_LARAB|nr:succinate dehydrogenase/fumarate reductase iron-sulfur subunit [Larkinella arboricola]RAK02094.1 succinate dehydrogenase / fumarate reductase iron-sulfur subunit [Larkinella arboricola]